MPMFSVGRSFGPEPVEGVDLGVKSQDTQGTAADGLFAPELGRDVGALGRAELERAFADIQTRYRGLIDHLPAVIYLYRFGDGTMVEVSPGIRQLLGIEPDAWLDDPEGWTASIHPDDLDRVISESSRCVDAGEPFRLQYRAVRADGETIWISEETAVVPDERGEPTYWLGLMLDVSEFVRTRKELDEAQQKYGALVEQIPAIVYIDVADDDMSTSYVSPQIEALIGVTPAEYVADPDLWRKHLHPDDRDRAMSTYLEGRESGEPFTFEYRLLGRDGRVVWFSDSAIVIRDATGAPMFVHGVMLDITDRKAAEEQLAYLAYHDKLTGLPNRAMFEELSELAIARARRSDMGVAVLHLDLDNFKLVNDSLGHEAGDAMILELTERLREATRDTDLVCRPGGDEFIMLLADIDRTPPMPGGTPGELVVAESVAGRIQESLQIPFVVAGNEVYASASIGISMFPQDADRSEELATNAEAAMFRSKKAGPGGYALHVEDDADALSRLSLTTRLRKAVENETWTLHYQPLVSLATGDMMGVEALIRWQEPNGGLVPPGEFIPLAEEMGLIEAIGDWVVEEIGRQDTIWRANGLELEIGFNLSPRQLFQPDLVDKILSRIATSSMDPTKVVVEITESTAMTDPDRTQRILFDLHDRGLQLAIDDFGTGYSSLARLKHLPVDILKIDRSFVRDVDNDRDAASMVGAMIALATNLGMTPLAEGIETEGEWRFLADHGCTLGQGFHFSRPVPPAEILAMHRRSSIHLVGGAG
jgi:diguanylate cyclase (GGDEF)-like protein/PAS domain S-box-containing protein